MTKLTVGTKVKLRPDVLQRHARSIPAQLGYTHEQFQWREALGKQEGKIGVVRFVLPDSNYVNVDFNGDKIGINSTELVVKGGKGWKEAADHTGKAPRHKAAATKRKIRTVSKSPMVRKEKDWKKVAKRELEKELGVKTKVRSYQYYEDHGAIALESTTGAAKNGEREWVIFENSDKAEQAAKAKVKEDLENEPGIFTQSWLQNFITISDTDRNLIAGEEADNLVEDLEDNEEKEKAREKEYEEIKEALKDPVQYFVDDHGMYSREDLMKQSFIRIDIEKASEDAIRSDGVAHFLDVYDSSEVDLPSGAVAYGTN